MSGLKRTVRTPALKEKNRRIDPSRHIQLFDPDVFDNTRIDVIGCGAVGSRLAMEIAKLGVRNLHLWDNDAVEAHNIANQHYTLEDVGLMKVLALAAHIETTTGVRAAVHPERVEKKTKLGRVVFLCVDTKAARRNIFNSCLRSNLGVDLVIDTRMGAEELRVYGFNPNNKKEVAAWEETLTDDSKTVECVCRARITVGATAGITACLAVHRFLQWYKRELVKSPEHRAKLPVEQLMMLRPLVVIVN